MVEPNWLTAVPDRLAAKVASELANGETVLWAGRPGRRLDRATFLWSRMIALFVLALAGTALTLTMDGPVRIGAAVVAGLSWLIVLGGLLLPLLWRLGVVQQNFAYVVTTHRVLICYLTPTRGLHLKSLLPADLTLLACAEQPDGSGDLTFDGSERAKTLADGFAMIPNVREVERLIRVTLGA